MSWFGEQFTSITGKLSDFTKEVLIESSGLLSSEGLSGYLRMCQLPWRLMQE